MTLAVQVSVKLSNGVIYVVGGEDFDKFVENGMALLGDEEAFDALVTDMRRSITPVSGGAQAPAGQGFYTPPAAPAAPAPGGGRVSTQPVAVKIPWAEKAQADPFLTPLKASRMTQWDATNKQWILQPGVDLSPFARWLPPGV